MRRLMLLVVLLTGSAAMMGGRMAVLPEWSTQFSGTWTWNGATNQAANLVEGGNSDWRLPTRAEWQAAIQNGTVGQLVPNLTGNNYFWTADTQGTRAWAVKINTDANGNVIPAQSGSTTKLLKGSAIYAIAIRP